MARSGRFWQIRRARRYRGGNDRTIATGPSIANLSQTKAQVAGEPVTRRNDRADLVGHDQDVAIEVYYHQGHEYNVDNMVQAIKDSLGYFTRYFSPYQHRQVRIIEFPRYQSFAQSFPNTIPYSEAIGFVARVDPNDPDDIDYPYYVTAHEVAHQWWAHQAIGGNVQGATMLSETMAQYSALMVMKRKVGPGSDATLPALRAGQVSGRPRIRAQEGNAAGARREPGLHPLQQREPGDVCPGGLSG